MTSSDPEVGVRAEPERFVCVTDRALRFVAVSDDYAAMLGYDPGDLIGRSGRDLLVELDETIEERLQAIERDGHNVDVTTLRHRSGRHIRFAYRVTVISGRKDELLVTVGEPVVDGRAPAGPRLTLLTRQEAASIARVHVRTIDRAIADGDLQASGARGRRRVALVELLRWLGLVLMIVLLLLGAVELLDLVMPGDFGFPPGAGHSLGSRSLAELLRDLDAEF